MRGNSKELARDLERIGALCESGPAKLEALTHDAAARLVKLLFSSWVEGRIPPHIVGVTDATAANRRLGWLWWSLPKHLTEPCALERFAQTDAELRRWCWIPSWRLTRQDEEVFLMADEHVALLLAEAAEGCPKRDYVLEIVAHHARDSREVGLLRRSAARRPGRGSPARARSSTL